MKLMLASTEQGQYENLKDIYHLSKYNLMSYYYLKDKTGIEQIMDSMKKSNAQDNFMLDSGAFTFMVADKFKESMLDSYIKEYVLFVKKYKIKRYVEMDIDTVVGYDRVKEIRSRLEREIGWQCVPVWHKGRGMDEWKKHVDEYDYIAIGGFVDKSEQRIKRNEHEDIKSMVAYANHHKTKVHGLGFTPQDSWKYGFYSVDSSSWSMGHRYGRAYKFINNKIQDTGKPENTRANYEIIIKNNYIEWCKFQRYVETKGYWANRI